MNISDYTDSWYESVKRKRINAWLVKRYGEGVLNHPVFANTNPQVEVEGLPEVTDQSISSTES